MPKIQMNMFVENISSGKKEMETWGFKGKHIHVYAIAYT